MKSTNVMCELIMHSLDDNFDPDYITTLLNIEPTYVRKKGCEFKTFSGRTKISLESVWQLETEYEESCDIEIQINKLIDQFRGKEELLKEVKIKYDLEIKICVVIYIKKKKAPGMYLNKEILKFIYSLEAEVDFDVYVV